MPVQYRERPKHRTKFENRIAGYLAWMDDANPEGKKGRKLLSLSQLAISEDAKVAMVEQWQALRVGKSRSIKKADIHKSFAKFLQQVDEVSASNPIVLRRVVARDGTIYPLRTEITVVVKHAVKTAKAFIHELKWLEQLFGKGASDDLAIDAFSESFHHLVVTHHRKPPHLLTEEDKKINRVLDHLIDWGQFEVENPIDQPLWGKIGKHDEEGYLLVYWICGPRGESNEESRIFAPDTVNELDAIGEGNWFYGAGRVFLDRIEWTSRPVQVPDPHDEAAVRAAWDLIPSHVMSNLDAWPLKKRG
jgi:hypothetical protein